MNIEFVLNGKYQAVDVDPRESLLAVLREYINLRGTKFGCGEGECGTCTVLLNNRLVTSCLVLAGQVHGSNIITIEGMTDDPIGQHVISAFVELGSVQCGFCTPGMIISTRELLSRNSTPSIDEIQTALGGNLCRCTGYKKIIDAVVAAGKIVASNKISIEGNVVPTLTVDATGFMRPESIFEALLVLANECGWHILGGGTDVLVKNKHQLKEKNWLDVSILPGFKDIHEDENTVIIGGGVTFSDILHSHALQNWAKPLVQAANQIGAIQIQNRATLAGNLVNASPAADAIPALFVLGASIVLLSVDGQRVIPVDEFASGPGQTLIAPDELITKVTIPKKSLSGQEISFFSKLGVRKSQSISIASVAVRGWLEDGLLKDRVIALGAVAPTVIFSNQSSDHLMAGRLDEARILEAGEQAARICVPIDDIRGSALYRRRLIRGLLVQGLLRFLQEIKPSNEIQEHYLTG